MDYFNGATEELRKAMDMKMKIQPFEKEIRENVQVPKSVVHVWLLTNAFTFFHDIIQLQSWKK